MNNNERAQINYTGPGVNELLRNGQKIVTLRRPHAKYDIPAGTAFVANCVTDQDQIPGMVIANDTRPINRFPDATLLLDGYPNAEVAAEDLANIYEDTTVDSLMQRLATLPDEIWESLATEDQEKLLMLGLDDAMKLPEFRQVFMPALLHWFVHFEITSYDVWHEWLIKQGLVSAEEIEAKISVDEETEYFYLDTLYQMGGLAWLLNLNHDAPEYRNVVLHEPISIPFDE